MQGVIHTICKTGDLSSLWWRLLRHWEAISLRRASMITAESQWAVERAQEVVPHKQARRIEYGVYPSYYEVDWEPVLSRPEVLCVGGLCRAKGTDILLEMLRRHPDRTWGMVFAGSGRLDQALRELSDPKIEVLGTISTKGVQERMARAWALAHPSRADSSPNVVKEARVIGLPVVGSRHGGHAEYIESGKDGFIIDSEDPDEWFRVLDGLCSDYEKCRLMGAARHDHFRDHFRPENTARAFLDLYREVLSK
jgi:glycosyltransferase involved in cell wall biosynthesis